MAVHPVTQPQQQLASNVISDSNKKRTATTANLDSKPHRPVKRRASKACQCCRSRKVRCNVVEHGAPCTNCRLDQVECIITESKRKRYYGSRKNSISGANWRPFRKPIPGIDAEHSSLDGEPLNSARSTNAQTWPTKPALPTLEASNVNGHIPHSLCTSFVLA